jgi:hypothetical protein
MPGAEGRIGGADWIWRPYSLQHDRRGVRLRELWVGLRPANQRFISAPLVRPGPYTRLAVVLLRECDPAL